MVSFSGPPKSAIRNQPISQDLHDVLSRAAVSAGIDRIVITSGGQDTKGQGSRRTGSTRHDRGRAADLQLVVGTTTLTFTDQAADPIILDFITAAAAEGATGIGAGVAYMGNRTIHVGFGTSAADTTELTWGAGGSSATAPQWLRDAARAGWAMPAPRSTVMPGRYTVMARSGLRLRGGPGTSFPTVKLKAPGTGEEVEAILPVGTVLTVLAPSSDDPAWVKVDLQDDGLYDGFVLAEYLDPVTARTDDTEMADEPDENGTDAA